MLQSIGSPRVRPYLANEQKQINCQLMCFSRPEAEPDIGSALKEIMGKHGKGRTSDRGYCENVYICFSKQEMCHKLACLISFLSPEKQSRRNLVQTDFFSASAEGRKTAPNFPEMLDFELDTMILQKWQVCIKRK